MDLELLRTFLEVCRTRHFGRAAEELHLTQAAVSARVKLLEGHLGVQLFERHRRDIQLTPEGNRLVRHAENLIAEWRKARQDVASGDAATQQLAVGGVFSLWDILLQDWLHQLYCENPDLALIAEAYGSEVLRRRVLDGIHDVVFMFEPPQLEELMIEAVATIRLNMVSDRPGLNTEQAIACDYLMVDWGLAHALQHNRLFPEAYVHRFRFGQARIALNFLRSFGGAAYLPERLVASDLAEGKLFAVEGAPVIEHTAFAVYGRYSARRELIEHSLEAFSGLPVGT